MPIFLHYSNYIWKTLQRISSCWPHKKLE